MQINSRLLYDDLQKRAIEASAQSFSTGKQGDIGFAVGIQHAAYVAFDLTHRIGLSVDVAIVLSELYAAALDYLKDVFCEEKAEGAYALEGILRGLFRAREVVDIHRRDAEVEQAAVEADEPPEPKPEVFYPYED